MFARIEQYIPVYPASPEHTAPTRKLITVFNANGDVLADMWYPTNTTSARAVAISPIVVYCRFRKASAPSRIAFEIACISAVPVSEAITARASISAASRASTPTTIAIHRYIRPSFPT